ncbi:50S ribosomal protein L29 [Capilliphycus salinus ALCB114379]|uniref:50S ribosomal protein L29 n=1 Tax=Capilliphycus salinus TaxID=2768948 RepID=UPI0039A65700
MSLPKIKDARELSDEQLSDRILELKKELANLRLLKGTGRLEKPHQFKHVKHELAQLFTVETERRHQQAAEAETTSAQSETTGSTAAYEPVSAEASSAEDA